jgi:hypothetical protein
LHQLIFLKDFTQAAQPRESKMEYTHKVIKSIKPILQWQLRKAEAMGSNEITIEVERAKELLNLAIASSKEIETNQF